MKKKVVVIDGGGRGAALVDAYSKSPKVGKIIAIPGNDLMQTNTKKRVETHQVLKTTSVREILEICQKEKVDLVDVAQDNAVEAGLVDELIKNGIPVIGPTRAAGQIEWDKAWSRKLMEQYNIPHPKFKICHSEKEGLDFLKKQKDQTWAIKAAGLAEGKGVILAKTKKEALAAVEQMKKFGNAGETYLLEEFLQGEEFSAFAICSGLDFQILGFAQDHKKVFDFDEGPNTGGMGCVSNPRIINKNIEEQVKEIFKKVLRGIKKEAGDYKGILYLGGMVVGKKGLPAGRQVYVIEFNARWGDPEAQVLLPSIENDLYDLSLAVINRGIKNLKLKTDKKIRVVVAGTSRGYPVDYSEVKGKQVLGLEQISKDIKVYGAGIKKVGKKYLVSGGRVLYLVGGGKDILEAREKVYSAMSQIFIEGNNLHYRTDIGFRDMERLF